MEIHEFLLNAEGIFWVSMAAGGGFLLNRFPALASEILCFSSSCFSFFSRSFCSFCSFSALLFSLLLSFSPWSDLLGDKQISSAAESLPTFDVLIFNGSMDGFGFSGSFSVPLGSGARAGKVCERGIGGGRRGDCGVGIGDL